MKWRLLAAFIGVTVVVLAAHDIPLASYVRSVERDRLLASLERDAFVLAGSAEDALSGEAAAADPAQVQSTADLYAGAADDEGAEVVVTDAVGDAVAVSGEPSRVGSGYANRPEIAAALTGTPATGERFSDTLGAPLVYVAVPVLSGADVVGAVRITYPAAVVDRRAGDTVRGLVIVGLISLVAAGVAALFMATTITGPLQRLQRTTERVAQGDLTSRAANDEGPPEVRRLADSFNTMTERVTELLDRQRAFAGDASHQLRTPLTALRLQLERAADMVEADPVGARSRLEAAAIETERLQRLVDGLLMLARTERSVDVVVVDVSSVAAERVDTWGPLADERGIVVVGHISPSVRASTVPDAVEQIVDNLIDNAVGIVPAGSTVEVSVGGPTATEPMVTLVVADRGPGMTDDQLAHARDRFWRAADARNDGSGLGLAIVDHLARAGRGSVELANRPGGGLTVTVRLVPA